MYEKYFEHLKEECLIRNRSSQTAETYISNISSFMKWTGNKPVEKLSLKDAREFTLFKRKCGVSASTCNFYNSSIAFLYKHVLQYTIRYSLSKIREKCELKNIFKLFSNGYVKAELLRENREIIPNCLLFEIPLI